MGPEAEDAQLLLPALLAKEQGDVMLIIRPGDKVVLRVQDGVLDGGQPLKLGADVSALAGESLLFKEAGVWVQENSCPA